MNVPAISIVLPTFNGARFLEQSVESCRQQTFVDWELIIVDDGSTDATPDLIQKIFVSDSRIRSIRHKENRKLPAALNTGFSSARGKYFTWTSDDNLYKLDAFWKMFSFLESNPDIDIIYSGYEVIDPAGHTIRKVDAAHPYNLIGRNSVGPCFLYRSRVHNRLGGYDVSLFLAEDYDYWLRASVFFKMVPLQENLYRYRTHNESLSIKHTTSVDMAHRSALHRSLPEMKWLPPRIKALGWLNLSALARVAGDWKDFLSCFLNASRLSPLVTILVLFKVLFLGRRISRMHLLRPPEWLYCEKIINSAVK